MTQSHDIRVVEVADASAVHGVTWVVCDNGEPMQPADFYTFEFECNARACARAVLKVYLCGLRWPRPAPKPKPTPKPNRS